MYRVKKVRFFICRPDKTEFMLSYTAPIERGLPQAASIAIRSDDRDRPEVRVPLVVGSVLQVPAGGFPAHVVLVLLLAVVAVQRLR